ncbi:MAG TPA: DNA polymerase I [Candidatus Eisenbacteria bacterium]|nr:DNA polymerase I [Candidatus Eisenbacteria bacterium]
MVSTPRGAKGASLLLVDGSALLYRAHFAFIRNPLRTAKGEVTSAVFGVLQTLLPVLDQRKPDRVAVVFDTAAPTFRHRAYTDYKAHRPPMPEDLAAQIPRVREVLRLLGLPIVEQEGVEADDLIGTLAKEAEADGATAWLLTSDKDFYQLVSERILILSPRGRGAELAVVDRAGVRERYGVAPEEMIDLLALMGDASDNVPGVPGVGEKTAAQLIQKFKTMEALYASLDQVERASLREKLRTNEDRARLSRMLATIRADLPVDRHWWELIRNPVDYGALLPFLQALELHTHFRRFSNEAASGAAPAAAAAGTAASAPEAPPVDDEPAGDLFPETAGSGRSGRSAKGARNRAGSTGPPNSDAATVETSVESSADERPALGRYAIVTDGAALEALARALSSAKGPVAFDTETTGLDPQRADLVGIGLSLREGEAYYLPVGHAGGPNLDPEQVRAALRPFFSDPKARRAAQNAKYDWHVLHRFGIPVHDISDDTMVAAYLADPDRPKNLDALASTRLGIEKIPTESLIGARGRDQKTMAELPVERVGVYCCEDADVVLRLVPILEAELRAVEGLALYREVEVPLVGVLVRMERAGVKIDTAALEGMSRSLGEAMSRLDHEIQEAAGVPFNVKSTRQVAEVLFERLKLPKGKRTKDGYSTDEEVLETLSPLHPIPRLLLDYRQAQKLKSAYVDSLPKLVHPETGRVHATFHQTIASTGRLSASDPSLQNIPIRSEEGRAIRRAFVADGAKGILASFDYSQIELRLLAHFSHDPVLSEAFRVGGDVHTATAARLFGVAPEAVTSAQRGQAKTVNFGILYGMGAARLARELSLSRSLASAFIDEYKKTHAGVAAYMEEMLARARERGYAETMLHRRRPLPGLRDTHEGRRAEAERAAINTPIQGSAADLIKVAMVKIDALTAERGLRSRLILQVHDELLFETDEEEIEILAPLVLEAMEHALPLRVPLVVHRGRGRNWDEAHA